MKTLKQIISTTPQASIQKPKIRTNEDGATVIITGSPADACRLIEALRLNGYTANIENPRSPQTIAVS